MISILGCVLFKGFKTYKAYYYGLYIQTARNIIIDSVQVADSSVGLFLFVIGPPGNFIFKNQIILFKFIYQALSHIFGNNSIIVRNSMVIGSITPNDCGDVPDQTTLSAIWNPKAIPELAADSTPLVAPGSRVGLSFPYFSSAGNEMPMHPYTCISAYPTSKLINFDK